MTSAERTELRQAIDAEKRRRISQARGRGLLAPACCGCGGPAETQTPGCRTCWNRHRERRRRKAIQAGTYEMAHGTTWGAKAGCKCRACRDAINARDRARRAARRDAA